MRKKYLAVLVVLIAAGCSSEEEHASEPADAHAIAQDLVSIIASKPKDEEDDDAEHSAPTPPYTPPFGIQPLGSNIFDIQKQAQETEAYAKQTEDDLRARLAEMTAMSAVSEYNRTARDLQMEIRSFSLSNDPGDITRVRRSFDALKSANQGLRDFDSSTASRNDLELQKIERSLVDAERARKWP